LYYIHSFNGSFKITNRLTPYIFEGAAHNQRMIVHSGFSPSVPIENLKVFGVKMQILSLDNPDMERAFSSNFLLYIHKGLM